MTSGPRKSQERPPAPVIVGVDRFKIGSGFIGFLVRIGYDIIRQSVG